MFGNKENVKRALKKSLRKCTNQFYCSNSTNAFSSVVYNPHF